MLVAVRQHRRRVVCRERIQDLNRQFISIIAMEVSGLQGLCMRDLSGGDYCGSFQARLLVWFESDGHVDCLLKFAEVKYSMSHNPATTDRQHLAKAAPVQQTLFMGEIA